MRPTRSTRALIVALGVSMAGCELAVSTDGLTGGPGVDATTMDGAAPGDAATRDTTNPLDANRMDVADARADATGADGSDAADAADGAGLADAPPDASAPPTLVQQTSGTAASVSSAMLTLPALPTNGDALILVTADTDTAPATVGGGGVIWTLQASSGTHVVTSVWTGFGAASGTASVALSWTSPTISFAGILVEWRGVSTFQVAQEANGTTNAVTTPAMGAIAGQLLIAAGGMHGPTEGDSVTGLGGGFLTLSNPAINDVTALGAYLVPSSAGSYQAQWTQSVTDGWDAIIARIQP